MAESACAALRLREDVNLLPRDLLVTGDYHLGDALSIFYDEIVG